MWVMQLQNQEVTTYDEVFNHHLHLKTREKYREGTDKEFRKMTEREVWRKLQRKDIPEGRRCVKCKWVFEIKRNGVFRCQLLVGIHKSQELIFREHTRLSSMISHGES
jgi:hypothetical protein